MVAFTELLRIGLLLGYVDGYDKILLFEANGSETLSDFRVTREETRKLDLYLDSI